MGMATGAGPLQRQSQFGNGLFSTLATVAGVGERICRQQSSLDYMSAPESRVAEVLLLTIAQKTFLPS